MEALSMPLREIKKKYTKSDMVIMAWRSQEVSHNMRQKANVPQRDPSTTQSQPTRERDQVDDTVKSAYGLTEIDKGNLTPVSTDDTGLEERMGSVIAGKLDEDLDLRKLTGREALRFMGAMGIHIPAMSMGGRPPDARRK